LVPVLLPEPVEPEVEPEPELPPMPPVVLLGEVVLDDEPPALPVLEEPVLPAEPPVELDDLLKYASHSVFDTWPSLFVSTEENSGAVELELLPDMPLLPEAPAELLPEAPVDPDAPLVELGELDELPEALGRLDEPELEEPGVLEESEDPVVALGVEDELPLAPVEPLLLPLVCAHAVVATNAAATAALISFNVIEASFEGVS
jgi:hypothetical protein